MHVLSVLMVVVGLVALLLSLFPLAAICRHETSYRLGWRSMFVLVLAFILGYLFYFYYLMFKVPSLMEFILAGIFAGGGLFVVLVSRMSLASLNELQASSLEHREQALHDELTGLPNRKNLMLSLANTIAASGRTDASFAILVMDLNGFKEVNDTLGHQAGDLALQIIAPRLKKQLRQTDTLCRMGGDEFAIILPQAERVEAERVAKKILSVCTEAMEIENNKIILGISIGISLSPEHARDGSTLIRYADIAMYQAKKYQLGFEIYRNTIDNLSYVPEILLALKNKKLVVYFQPIFSGCTLIGMEVSLLWHKEDGSVIIARDFLKSLVDLGASWPFVEYVVDEAFSHFSRWAKQFDHTINLRLNLFLAAIDKDEFCDFIIKKAAQYQILTENIMMEISEELLSRSAVIELMNDLQCRGFKIALDDFGSQGGKLLLLQKLALDEVKLDCSLIKCSEKYGLDEALIDSLKLYCRSAEIPLVISHVENDSDLKRLNTLGIQHVQGDLLCPFLSAVDMDDWLRQFFQSSLDN